MGNGELSDNEERYSQLRSLNGKKKYEAYGLAFEVRADVPRKSLYEMASRLERRVKIQSRIAELRAMAREASIKPGIADLVERKQHLTKLLRNQSDEPVSHRDQIAANKTLGDYEKDLGPNNNPPPPSPLDEKLRDMTYEALAELLVEIERRKKALREGEVVVVRQSIHT